MLKTREKGILETIIKHCNSVERLSKGLTREAFDKNEDIRNLLCFHLEQIGEAAKHLSEEFVLKYSSVPWKKICGTRDRIAHGYDFIDDNKVWDTVTNDIIPLHENCSKILEENK